MAQLSNAVPSRVPGVTLVMVELTRLLMSSIREANHQPSLPLEKIKTQTWQHSFHAKCRAVSPRSYCWCRVVDIFVGLLKLPEGKATFNSDTCTTSTYWSDSWFPHIHTEPTCHDGDQFQRRCTSQAKELGEKLPKAEGSNEKGREAAVKNPKQSIRG